MLKPCVCTVKWFLFPNYCSHILMEDPIQCFSLIARDTSFSNNLHLNFILAVAPIATIRPCHQLELLHFWNPELWNSPFWPQPLILLSVPTLSCPWNMFFGLIGTLDLLTFPYVSSYHSLLTPFLFQPCLCNYFYSTLISMFSSLTSLTCCFICLSSLWLIIFFSLLFALPPSPLSLLSLSSPTFFPPSPFLSQVSWKKIS